MLAQLHKKETQERCLKSPKKSDTSSSQMRLLGGTPHIHYVVCTVTYNALVRDDVILLCLASERKVIGAVTCVSGSLAHNQLIIVWDQVQYTVHSTLSALGCRRLHVCFPPRLWRWVWGCEGMVPLVRTRLILKQPFQMFQADIIFMGISIRLQTV